MTKRAVTAAPGCGDWFHDDDGSLCCHVAAHSTHSWPQGEDHETAKMLARIAAHEAFDAQAIKERVTVGEAINSVSDAAIDAYLSHVVPSPVSGTEPLSPFMLRAADRLYSECERAVREGRVDARSPIGDATLDYREIREEGGPPVSGTEPAKDDGGLCLCARNNWSCPVCDPAKGGTEPTCTCGSQAVIDANRHDETCWRRLWTLWVENARVSGTEPMVEAERMEHWKNRAVDAEMKLTQVSGTEPDEYRCAVETGKLAGFSVDAGKTLDGND